MENSTEHQATAPENEADVFKLNFKSGDGFIKVSDPEVLGTKFLTIEMQALYYEEKEPRNVHHFINKKQARKLVKRLNCFIKNKPYTVRKEVQL